MISSELFEDVHSHAARRFSDLLQLDAESLRHYIVERDAGTQAIHSIAALRPTDAVLDLGCGSGLTALVLAESARLVVGMDGCAAMLEVASRLAKVLELDNVQWREAFVPPVPVEDAAFDVSICRLFLHHLDAPEQTVREMVRATRPGGTVILVDEIVPSDRSVALRYNAWERRRDPTHRAYMEAGQIARMLKRAGCTLREHEVFKREVALSDVLDNSYGDAHEGKRQQLEDEALSGHVPGIYQKNGTAMFTTVDLVISAERNT